MIDYKFNNLRNNFFNLIIISLIFISSTRCDDDDDICLNPECDNLGEEVLRNMLPSVNPCEDFYEYACGNWTKNHPPPTPDSNWSVVEVILRNLYSKLKQLLSRKIIRTESEVVKKSKQLFQACMNTTKINHHGIIDMKKKLDEIGGWPIMYPPDRFDDSIPWEKVHYYFARMTGQGALFNIDVDQDYRHTMFNAIYLDQPSGMFGLFNSLTEPEHILKYTDFVKEVVMILVKATGTKATPQAIDKDIRDVFKLRFLLQITLNTSKQRPQPNYMDFTIDGLQQSTPVPTSPDQTPIDWLSIFKGTFQIIKNANIAGDKEIILREPNYILGLVHRILATPLRVLVNHIHLYFVEKHLSYMPENIVTLMHDTVEEISDIQIEKVERWQKCIEDHPMQHVLSSIYIHWYFPQSKRSMVNNLIADIKQTMKNRIQRATWLDSSTKQEALRKLNNMKNVIGSEEWYRHYDTKFEEYYKGQSVGRNYLQNILNFEQYEYKTELGYLTGESVTLSKKDFPILPNAYYERVNVMVLNVGQIQPPFYHEKFPPVVNYPGLGTVIGHEIGHAFDNGGRRYDHEGTRINWWSNSSFVTYRSKAKCLIKQYNAYSYKELENIHPDWRVRGKKTFDENFADLVGITVAYEAYKMKMKQHVKPSRIGPLKNFDNEKIFFLIYANTFCEYANEETMEFRATVDTHTTSRLRVNGPLSNMPEFSQAFNCAPGNPLNPVSKCDIW
ncbi:hypothetical protein KPH14_001370 [Odynerus spinipes]|uniref:Uncharacterized protein n=1 Tax=Odynerus spinipes TaxID=1348599 RepID=A0AAD9VKQ2_9HYME|nr:hypothetical protein KPH14_001370 [Odynerus spinipes]